MSCFETVKYAKPSICIPTQPEQMGNAAKLQKLNCSITVKNKQELRAAVQKIEKERQRFRRNAMALNEFSNKFKGLNRAVEIIESTIK
jgi:UDP:flavonoid glycosyltransferase YjiC (YdhE family)